MKVRETRIGMEFDTKEKNRMKCNQGTIKNQEKGINRPGKHPKAREREGKHRKKLNLKNNMT